MPERRNPFLPHDDDEGQDYKSNYDPEPVYIESDEDDFHIVLDDGSSKPSADEEIGKYWYVVHCYSGYENKVRHAIEQRFDTMGMKDRIFEVLIPTEEEVEGKDGKRRTVTKRVFPGYILVQMRLDEDSWYVVRNTRGVTDFVGNGNEPTPLTKDEVSKIIHRMEERVSKVRMKRGERGIWQRRYWEHLIRDEADFQAHMDYVLINPLKHGLVQQVVDWPYSTFHRLVGLGVYPLHWAGGDEGGVGYVD